MENTETHLWSMMRTLTPFLANALQAMTPAGPAPMMSTSTWLSDIDIDGVGDDIAKVQRWVGRWNRIDSVIWTKAFM